MDTAARQEAAGNSAEVDSLSIEEDSPEEPVGLGVDNLRPVVEGHHTIMAAEDNFKEVPIRRAEELAAFRSREQVADHKAVVEPDHKVAAELGRTVAAALRSLEQAAFHMAIMEAYHILEEVLADRTYPSGRPC